MARNKFDLYIASSLKNKELNKAIERVLNKKGLRCFLPQRDTIQSDKFPDQDKKISDMNIKGIKQSDVVLVVGRNLGKDTSWEAGFAKALRKRIYILYSINDKTEKDFMLFNSAVLVLETDYHTDLEEKVLKLLDAIMHYKSR